LGGAFLFAVGLAAGPWLFLVRLSPDASATPMTAGGAAHNVLLFTVFALHHSIMARSRAKQWLMARVPACLERSLYVWVASALFLLVCFAWQPSRGVAWRLPETVAWAGVAAQLSGLLLTALGARILDIWDLAGVRQVLERASPVGARAATLPESEPLDMLTTRGPFGLVRHPIYLGWLLLVWPTPVMTSGRLLFTAVSTIYLVIAIPLEERSLVAHHADTYRSYQKQVRWRLIPGIW
jgi:protein-S-isoprenylcysteine O-methyltransferase Ste14